MPFALPEPHSSRYPLSRERHSTSIRVRTDKTPPERKGHETRRPTAEKWIAHKIAWNREQLD